jgi:Immunity protein 74
MLIKVSNGEVRGDGFVVLVPDTHKVQYSEGDKTAILEIEGGRGAGGEADFAVYLQTLRGWERPNEFLEMTEATRQQILANVSKSLDVLGVPHFFVE